MVAPKEAYKILIIDDDQDWCTTFSYWAGLDNHRVDAAKDLQEALLKIEQAEKQRDPYHVAVIDRNFESGKEGHRGDLGLKILQVIKARYPHIACIMVSGENVTPDQVLDLRDNLNLDYYIPKDGFDILRFNQIIQKAISRVNPAGNPERKRQILCEALERWQGTRAVALRNLGRAEEHRAMEGMEATARTMNEIDLYKAQLAESERKIAEINSEIQSLK